MRSVSHTSSDILSVAIDWVIVTVASDSTMPSWATSLSERVNVRSAARALSDMFLVGDAVTITSCEGLCSFIKPCIEVRALARSVFDGKACPIRPRSRPPTAATSDCRRKDIGNNQMV
jgi:hypothetical protein